MAAATFEDGAEDPQQRRMEGFGGGGSRTAAATADEEEVGAQGRASSGARRREPGRAADGSGSSSLIRPCGGPRMGLAGHGGGNSGRGDAGTCGSAWVAAATLEGEVARGEWLKGVAAARPSGGGGVGRR